MTNTINDDQRFNAMMVQQQHSARLHYQSVGTGVVLPLVQAVIYGLFSGLLTALLAWYAAWPYPWRWFWLTWVIVAFFRYHIGIGRWWYIVNSFEQIFNLDINRDGMIGSNHNGRDPITLRLEVARDEGRSLRFGEFSTPIHKLVKYSRSVLGSRPNTEIEWCGRGKLFSEDEYRDMRDEFIVLDLAFWHNTEHHDQGWSFNDDGMDTLEKLAQTRMSNV